MIKKLFLASLLIILLLLPTIAYAKSSIDTLILVGKGIAVSPDDPMDLSIVKIAVGTVKTSAREPPMRIGVLHVDDTKYKIKRIERSEDGWISGIVFAASETKRRVALDSKKDLGTFTTGGEEVGTFSVSLIQKHGVEIWVGTLSLGEESYNLYINGLKRKAKPAEVKEKLTNFCKKNPGNEDCRVRSAEYCEEHTDDKVCKRMFLHYCKDHKDDLRCRNHFEKQCKEIESEDDEDEDDETSDEICTTFKKKRMIQYCRDHPRTRLCLKQAVDAGDIELETLCLKTPNAGRCEAFCERHPKKCAVGEPKKYISLAKYCLDHEDADVCEDYCRSHPQACGELAYSFMEFCADKPFSGKCERFCEAHPVSCKRVTQELADKCLGNRQKGECFQLCKRSPGVCKRIIDPTGES